MCGCVYFFQSKVTISGHFGSPISFVAWTQLEELKQQQKLDRQKEQDKKRRLGTDPAVELCNMEPVKEVMITVMKNGEIGYIYWPTNFVSFPLVFIT